jgi:hypothetical protein
MAITANVPLDTIGNWVREASLKPRKTY